MSYLNNGVRAGLRRLGNDFLKDRCKIEVEDNTSLNERGGLDPQWTVVIHNSVALLSVPCRIVTVGKRNRSESEQIGEQETITNMYMIACPAGTPFDISQRITIARTGLVYNVVTLETVLTDEIFAQAVITRQS